MNYLFARGSGTDYKKARQTTGETGLEDALQTKK